MKRKGYFIYNFAKYSGLLNNCVYNPMGLNIQKIFFVIQYGNMSWLLGFLPTCVYIIMKLHCYKKMVKDVENVLHAIKQ